MALLQTIHFWGLSAASTAALFGGTAAVVVGLYMLRLRQRQLEVPFVQFWDQAARHAASSRLFRRLRRFWSLLLALLMVALLALALGDPRLTAETPPQLHVLMLDVSASMSAAYGKTTRLAHAQQQAIEYVDRMPAGDRAVVVAAGASPHPQTGQTDRADLLREAIRSLTTTDAALNLSAAVRLATDLATEERAVRTLLWTDGAAMDHETLHAVLGSTEAFIVGDSHTNNVGIASFSARMHPLDSRRNQVRIQLRNERTEPSTVTLQLEGEASVLLREPVTVPAGATWEKTMDDLGGLQGSLRASIEADGWMDALAADDRARVVLPQKQRVRLGVVSEQNLYLQAALLLDEYLEVREAQTLPELGDLAAFDVLLFSNALPEQPPGRPAIFLNPDPRTQSGWSPLPVRGDTPSPYFNRIKKEHPLFRWVALRDVNIAEARRVRTEAGDQVLAGDKGTPLLVSGHRQQQPFYALLFDPAASDLPLRAAWPLLLVSMIDQLVPATATGGVSCIAGIPCRVPRPDTDTGGSDSRSWRLASMSNAGIFGQTPATRVAVNVDPREIAIGVDPTLAQAKEPAAGPSRVLREPRLWPWFVGVALLLCLVEWWTLQQRRTV